MPTYRIHVVNSNFKTCAAAKASSLDAARKQALRAALEIGSEEVCKGASFFGAEVCVELDGDVAQRFLVSIGQTPLKEGAGGEGDSPVAGDKSRRAPA